MKETKTFIEKMNSNPDLMEAMLSMPDRLNEQLPYQSRKEKFSFLWENTDMERVEVMNLVNQRELDLVREYKDYGLPEWMLRLEAQDVLLKMMEDHFKQEGIID